VHNINLTFQSGYSYFASSPTSCSFWKELLPW
jgi:hypothetical protein